jgi:hypothetical protein
MRSIQSWIANEENLWTLQAKKPGSETRNRLGGFFFHVFCEWMTQGAVKMTPAVLLLISTILLCGLMKSKRGEIRIIRFFKIGTY